MLAGNDYLYAIACNIIKKDTLTFKHLILRFLYCRNGNPFFAINPINKPTAY